MAMVDMSKFQRPLGRQQFNPMEDDEKKLAELNAQEDNSVTSSSETEVGANAGNPDSFSKKFAAALGDKWAPKEDEEKKKMSSSLAMAFKSMKLPRL